MTRVVHYIGFRGDEYARAYRVFGGPAFIHRVHDARAYREIDWEGDLVIFAGKEREDVVRPVNAPDVVGQGYTPEGRDRA